MRRLLSGLPAAFLLAPLLLAPLLLAGPVRAQIVSAPAPAIQLSASIPRSGTIPAVHFARSKAASNPIYCIVGDSTSTFNAANNIAPLDLLWGKLQKRVREDNPTKTLTTASFLNFAIGGASMLQAIGVYDGSNFPSWYTNHSATWLSYPQAAGCTTLFWNFGINDAGYQSLNEYTTLYSTLAGWSTIPDLVFITPAMASVLAGSPFSTPQYTIGAIANAALQRTLALSNFKLGSASIPSVGLIDINRYFNQKVLGVDPVAQYLSYSILPSVPVTGLTATSYTLPQTAGDFSVSITFPGTGAGTAMGAAGTAITVPFSQNTNTGGPTGAAAIYVGSSTISTVLYYGGPAGVSGSSVATVANANTFVVSAQDDHLQIIINGTIAYDGLIPRAIGTWTPALGFSGLPASFPYQIDYFAGGVAQKTNPTITNGQCYGGGVNGDVLGVISGNGINHDASPCLNFVYGGVLDATQF